MSPVDQFNDYVFASKYVFLSIILFVGLMGLIGYWFWRSLGSYHDTLLPEFTAKAVIPAILAALWITCLPMLNYAGIKSAIDSGPVGVMYNGGQDVDLPFYANGFFQFFILVLIIAIGIWNYRRD